MPRSGAIKKRQIKPDPLYNSQVVTKLIHKVMKDGKKTIAQKQVYKAFKMIEKQTKGDPLDIFNQALRNAKPVMEVRSRRVGGASYQVPYPVKGSRRESLALRWLIGAARSRPSKEYHTFADKLAVELIEASQNQGLAIKKKEEIHRMAEANKAFAHFRW